MTAQLNFESQLDQQSRNGDNSRKGLERTIMDSNGQTKLFKWERYFGGPGRLRYNLIGVILCYFDVCCSKTEKQSSAGEKEVKYSDAFPKQTQNIHQLPTLARVQRWTAKKMEPELLIFKLANVQSLKSKFNDLSPRRTSLARRKYVNGIRRKAWNSKVFAVPVPSLGKRKIRSKCLKNDHRPAWPFHHHHLNACTVFSILPVCAVPRK